MRIALLATLLLAACGSGAGDDPPPPDLASPPPAPPDLACGTSWLLGSHVCVEPLPGGGGTTHSWITFYDWPMQAVMDGHRHNGQWCRKLLEATVLQEQAQPPRARALLHHLAPANEVDYTLDANGSTWHFEHDGAQVFPDNTCTKCPSIACDEFERSPWTIEQGTAPPVVICDPTVNMGDAGVPVDFAGGPPDFAFFSPCQIPDGGDGKPACGD